MKGSVLDADPGMKSAANGAGVDLCISTVVLLTQLHALFWAPLAHGELCACADCVVNKMCVGDEVVSRSLPIGRIWT